ncbi:MAG: DUF1800 domain-containing protein [Vitreoscilla sp.]|nr:DUF1800 domain-containing protein [Vitreoscilla sp.]
MHQFLATARGPATRAGRLSALAASIWLAACGGAGDPAATETTADTERTATAQAVRPQGTTRLDAYRLLTQASFGPTEAEINRVTGLGAATWIDDQLAKPARAVHLARWNADDAAAKARRPGDSAGAPSVISSFYQQALQADDQLRQRMVFALSQIFVVSLADLGNERAQSVAGWNDMLARNAFGNFRTLLQEVAMHPAMGQYLSHLKNRKEDLVIGRVPDQNFAREVMQLFTIGLHQLNTDGSVRVDANGKPLESYGAADIVGMSKVFTGFSWGGPDTSNERFNGVDGWRDPQRMTKAMQGYPQFHATNEKRFLGVTIPVQATADPAASLKVALDTLFAHPNVGPFISRQLIQRLVTSAPSPAYVARVARVFANNGSGVRGDLKAVVRAILLDNEARLPKFANGPTYGKVREPVLRLTAFLRAFDARSDSGKVLMVSTDDPGLQLAQTPLRSPSVFNFFRPGYVPAGGEAASLGLTLPEMQITDESSVAGYANFMRYVVMNGVGQKGVDGKAARPDLQVDLSGEIALADQPEVLVDLVNSKLLGGFVGPEMRAEQLAAVSSVVIPPLKKNGGGQALIDKAKINRALTAVTVTLVTPEFIVQK